MTIASLNISVTEKRMMNEAEASSYCGLAAKHFKVVCPVRPVNLAGKVLRYDKRDLDQWIDAEKTDGEDLTHDGIRGKLE